MLQDNPPRLLFFTGKGGVGKTSIACSTAVALADQGKKVLLVSTDPASNLQQVLGQAISDRKATSISGVNGLDAININPNAAAVAYRNRMIDPVRTLLPQSVVTHMEEQLSGACTTEIAAFNEFTDLLTSEETRERYDHVVFDTAPTGHTLRLLQLPKAWSEFLESSVGGASCLGPLAGLVEKKNQYFQSLTTLADPATTVFVLVIRPKRETVWEAERTSRELSELGITNQRLVINAIMPTHVTDDPLAIALQKREKELLDSLSPNLAALPCDKVYLKPHNMVGLDAIRALVGNMPSHESISPSGFESKECDSYKDGTLKKVSLAGTSLVDLVDEIETDRKGLVMVLGKGGVGKTTIAAAIALALASRGHAVHLTTTDPAAHLSLAIDSPFPNLVVDRINPEVEVERYRQGILDTQGKGLDEASRALLVEDLRSPCTEEIAVFKAFARVIDESRGKFVIVDTAPTGHTLLLLDATGAYHREVSRHTEDTPCIRTALTQLQDPSQTKMILVTLAETTPLLEAIDLQEDLRRAKIEPWAWVVNSSIFLAKPTDPLLVARSESEVKHILKVKEMNKRYAIVPWQVAEPSGIEKLLALTKPTAGG